MTQSETDERSFLMKHAIANRKGILWFFVTAMLVFGILLFISLFLAGCGDSDNDLPETATVMVEVSSPKVLEPSDALHLTISTNFRGRPPNGLIYNTKKEFSITQDFNRTFQLDPDEPRISVELIKPGPSGAVRLTVLLDDEVEYEQSLTGTGFLIWNRDFSKKEISF